QIPIWIADYVLATYGTGAIMAVPAHDERDFEFAKKFDLPIIRVVDYPENEAPKSLFSSGFRALIQQHFAKFEYESAIHVVTQTTTGSRCINDQDLVVAMQSKNKNNPLPVFDLINAGEDGVYFLIKNSNGDQILRSLSGFNAVSVSLSKAEVEEG